MAQTNYTPIQIYYSTTAAAVPVNTNLVSGELAINITDGLLFYKDNGGTVQKIGYKLTPTTAGGTGLTSFTANGVVYASSTSALTTGSALVFDGTNLLVGTATALASATGRGNITINGSTDAVLAFGNAAALSGYILRNVSGITYFSDGDTFQRFFVNSSEQMRLTSTGLGIGTSSPAGKLTVKTGTNENLSVLTGGSGDMRLSALNDATSSTVQLSIQASPLYFRGSGGAINATLDSSGNLGLGVTPSTWYTTWRAMQGPTGKAFAIASSANGMYVVNNAYLDASAVFRYQASDYASYYQQVNSQHAWYTAPSGTADAPITFTQAMTLDASGNLLVGATSATQSSGGTSYTCKQVIYVGNQAGIYSRVSTTGAANVINNEYGSGTRYLLSFDCGATRVGDITSNGTLTVYGGTSDYRLKTVIGSVTGHGERIDALEPIEYTWNLNGLHTRGFLAHKFQEVYADSVIGTKDAVDANGSPVYQSMQAATSEVIADLVAEIQSLRKRLAAANL